MEHSITDPIVLYEDNHLLVLNKPCSLLTQGDNTGDTSLLDQARQYLKTRYAKAGNVFCGLVQRIDRPCSGAVIFAKTSKCLSRMNRMLRERQIRKIYWALVDRLPPHTSGELTHYLSNNARQNKSYAHSAPAEDRKKAQLRYRLVRSGTHYSLLEIELISGRKHQIRAQLAALNMHIRGDVKYGARRANPGKGISLHARLLEFCHPVSKENVRIIADPAAVQGDNLFTRLAEDTNS